MAKTAIYRGQKFNVIEEDDHFVTLEGYGYKKRHLKDDVMFENEPEEVMPNEYPSDKLVDKAPEKPLTNKLPDKGFIQNEEVMSSKLADLEKKRATQSEKTADVDKQIAQEKAKQAKVQSQLAKKAEINKVLGEEEMNTTMPSKEFDKYKEQGVDVNPETHADTQKTNDDRMKNALEGLRTSFRQMLTELDTALEEKIELPYAKTQIHFDAERETDDVNYNDLENHYDNLYVDDDADFNQVMTEDLNEEEESNLVNNNVALMQETEGNKEYYWEKYDGENIVASQGTFKTVREAYVDAQKMFNKEQITETQETSMDIGGKDIDENALMSLAKKYGANVIKVFDDAFHAFVNPKSKFVSDVKTIPGVDHAELVSEESVTSLTEEGAGTASVAGPGVSDGTTNQAINAVQGIATVPTRMGMTRRTMDMYESKLFTLDIEPKIKLEEKVLPNINRHIIADKIEEKLEPMNESEGCSMCERRKSRINAIGSAATLRECAKYIAENKYSCAEKKYIPRDKKMDENVILEEMKKIMGRVGRKVQKI